MLDAMLFVKEIISSYDCGYYYNYTFPKIKRKINNEKFDIFILIKVALYIGIY